MTLSFSADDEAINIILHVPSTSERQDYDQPGNVMLLTRYLMLNNISNALCILHEVSRTYTSRSLLHTYTANLNLATDFRKIQIAKFSFQFRPTLSSNITRNANINAMYKINEY